MSNFFQTPADIKVERKNKILAPLNDQQRMVAKDYNGFSMVSAGPGAGKLVSD